MFVLLTFLFLVAAPLAVGLAYLFSPKRNFTWVIVVVGAFVAWVLTLLWQLRLPETIILVVWQPEQLFLQSVALHVDGVSWVYGLSLVTLCLAVVLTMPVRMTRVGALPAVGNMLLTALGLFAVLADNPLTLLLAWSAIDLTEVVVLLRAVQHPEQSERVVVGFSARLAGSLLALWTIAFYAPGALSWTDGALSDSATFLFLLSAALRFGVFPFNLPFESESVLRRGFGSILRVVGAASSLVLLARLPATQFSANLDFWMLLTVGMMALYAAWRWANGSTLLGSRPFWIIALASLALAADLRGSPAGSLAWGSALVLLGGMIFIFSHETRWLKGLVAASVFGLSGLPFAMTATGWESRLVGWDWSLVLFVPAQVLLMVGFVRFTLAPRDALSEAQPQGAQSVYPVAFVILFLVVILLGLWGWEGAGQVGHWQVGLVGTLLAVVLTFVLMRLQTLVPARLSDVEPARVTVRGIGSWLGALLWGGYRLLRQGSFVLLRVLEGDGGVLWAFVLLALVINLLVGGR